MIRTGIDIVEIARIERLQLRHAARFTERVFTATELAQADGRAAQLAGRFAAKEAAMKLLGTGRKGIGWRAIELVNDRNGCPSLRLHDGARERAAELGVENIAISVTHSAGVAVAVAVAESAV